MMAKGKEREKPLCFVIGPIGKDGGLERKHADLLLNAVIKEVLQAEEFNYAVKRADEDADPGMIGDRVITDIIHASLVVADLTDLNPNAFYELGIRHSAEKPAIHLAKAGTSLPFDNFAHRTIFVDLSDWQSIVDARNSLARSARAIKEPGFKVSNPITQAHATFNMRESADPRERFIADLQERVLELENRIRTHQPRSDDLLPGIDPATERILALRLNKFVEELKKTGEAPELVKPQAENFANNLGLFIVSSDLVTLDTDKILTIRLSGGLRIREIWRNSVDDRVSSSSPLQNG